MNFRNTMMFTCRSYNLKLRNTSTVMMHYECELLKGDRKGEGEWDPGYFSVSNKTGNVQPDCDEEFTIRFQPTEVEMENMRYLHIHMDNLSPN